MRRLREGERLGDAAACDALARLRDWWGERLTTIEPRAGAKYEGIA
jgi:hypothetical protein